MCTTNRKPDTCEFCDDNNSRYTEPEHSQHYIAIILLLLFPLGIANAFAKIYSVLRDGSLGAEREWEERTYLKHKRTTFLCERALLSCQGSECGIKSFSIPALLHLNVKERQPL